MPSAVCMNIESNWARLLAYVTGLVNQELLLQNEYLAAENRILRSHLPSRLRLSDPERETLAEIGKRLGRKGLAQVCCVSRPDTILAWYRRLIAAKFDGSKHRSYPGRPRIQPEVEALVVRFARENSGWGYDRIAGALANLGHDISDQTATYCGGTASLPLRSGARRRPGRTSSRHILRFCPGLTSSLLEVLTWRGLATYYVLFVIQLETRRVTLAGFTRHRPRSGCNRLLANREAVQALARSP
jgi:putative transposase